MTNIENKQLENIPSQKRSQFGKTLITLALCGTLIGVGTTSCGRATEKDVIKETQKFEIVKNDLRGYIDSRKEFVRKFNTLLAYPTTPQNQSDINNTLRQLYDTITKYDDLIKKLGKEKLDTEAKLNKYITESATTGGLMPSTPISEDRWDFLLLI